MIKHCLPKIIGHRGAKSLRPENTFSSFQLAIQKGLSWIETDVKLTKDNKLILMHDDKLERTTNGNGLVAQKKFNDIKKLDAGSWFSPEYSEEKVPSLEETIKFLKEYKISANLEIKGCEGRERLTSQIFAETIHELWPQELPILVSSFHIPSLFIVREKLKNIPIGLLFEGKLPQGWKSLAHELQATSIHLDHNFITEKITHEIKQENLDVLVYTVNEKKRALELFSYGVTSVFSDLPTILD